MASKQSDAVRKLYQGWLRAFAENPDWTPDDRKDLIERWNVLTTEPGSVDYIEIDAPGGVPAPRGRGTSHLHQLGRPYWVLRGQRTACRRAFTSARSNSAGSKGPPTHSLRCWWSSCEGSPRTLSRFS